MLTASGAPKSAGDKHTASASRFILLAVFATIAAAQRERDARQARDGGDSREVQPTTLSN